MKKYLVAFLLAAGSIAVLGGTLALAQSPSPTDTPTASPTATPKTPSGAPRTGGGYVAR